MNYPQGTKRPNKVINYSNRGMDLETDINNSNKYYLDTNRAVIYKKPTPITVNKVDFKSRDDVTITEAKFKIPSTTDYNGIYRGYYIDFEAKETKNKVSFPLNNIHSHQIKHLMMIDEHGGIGFIIVRFTTLAKTYYLGIKELKYFLDNYDKKSIPLSFFEKYGFIINEGLRPRLDYLKIIDMKVIK